MTSTRVWLICGLVTAVAVTAVLALTKRPDGNAGPSAPQAPPPLTEQEVRAYLLVKPAINAILEESALEFARTRRIGQLDSPELGARNQARIEALLQGQHMTLKDWEALQFRVERVVNLIRAEAEFQDAKPGIAERLVMKKDVLKGMAAGDPRRRDVEREIREAESLLASGPEKVSEKDREIALRFWASLDPLVPTVGPAPAPPGSPSRG